MEVLSICATWPNCCWRSCRSSSAAKRSNKSRLGVERWTYKISALSSLTNVLLPTIVTFHFLCTGKFFSFQFSAQRLTCGRLCSSSEPERATDGSPPHRPVNQDVRERFTFFRCKTYCSSQPSMVNWLSSSNFPCLSFVCSFVAPLC